MNNNVIDDGQLYISHFTWFLGSHREAQQTTTTSGTAATTTAAKIGTNCPQTTSSTDRQ